MHSAATESAATVGVLALQGDVREHRQALERLGVVTVKVRAPEDLENIDGLVIPGGESTTIGKLATLYGMMDPLRKVIGEGLPTYGTCAGLILLSRALDQGEQPLLGVLDVVTRRNSFGGQSNSFEADLDIEGIETPFRGVFIRAPWVTEAGDSVDVLSAWLGHPVMVRSHNILASAFHPELTDDDRVHALLVNMIEEG